MLALIMPVVAGLTLLASGRAVVAGGTPAASYPARRAAALARLDSRLLIVPSQASFKDDDQAGFQQATDFFYFTGLGDVVGSVLILDGASRSATLFLPHPNPAITRPAPPTPGFDQVLPVDSLDFWIRRRFPAASGVLVSPNDARGQVKTPAPMAGTVARWEQYLRNLGWSREVGSGLEVTRPLREIKDADEIATLSRVGAMSGAAMLAGIRALKPGIRQRQAEAKVILSCLEAGGRHSFWPWTMSGPHAVFTDLFNSFVDYEGHDRVMTAGEVVRVDVGCQTGHYMGDVGRTAPVSGRFSPGQREAWNLFIAGYRAGLTALKDGAKTTDVYQVALAKVRATAPSLKTAEGKKAAEILLGPNGTDAWEIHGVGLDDAEGMPAVLKAGMTVAYELMFMVDGDGFYLEDMILIEPNGYRLLTPGLPYTAAEIEGTMARAPTRR